MWIKMLPFIIIMIVSMLLTISANSWFTAWIGLEINLMAMIPVLILTKGQESPEPAIKYFLIQALGSSSMVFFILLMKTQLFNNPVTSLMLSSSLLLKSGVAPLHFWFPSMIEDSSWMACFYLMTVQKIAPITLMVTNLPSSIILASAVLSVVVGSLGGLNQTSLKKIMAYSSITHLGWILSSLHLNNYLFMMYNLTYWMLVLSIINPLDKLNLMNLNQITNMNSNMFIKSLIMFNFLSMGGLPPFMGFLPKLLVIQAMIQNSMSLISSLMVIMTLLTLFYYIKIVITIMTDQPPFNKTNNPTIPMISNYPMMVISTSSIGLFPLASLLFYSF
uniref:NADH-ubiquinone oxidoreductase chain 2 n=1 Tax=Myrmecophilus manni TaxID=270849 RepID=B6DE87_9ORTH|nr:NADH dehydrogenase subunit 2 [Myrmecophilus manni]ACG59283.1 NADH dehydrogenase subunit 2 [Myrmecophilus manni]